MCYVNEFISVFFSTVTLGSFSFIQEITLQVSKNWQFTSHLEIKDSLYLQEVDGLIEQSKANK